MNSLSQRQERSWKNSLQATAQRADAAAQLGEQDLICLCDYNADRGYFDENTDQSTLPTSAYDWPTPTAPIPLKPLSQIRMAGLRKDTDDAEFPFPRAELSLKGQG